jgi:hypothetical protein
MHFFILTLLCLIFPFAGNADPGEDLQAYTRTLKELETKIVDDRIIFWIKLSDDSIWQWTSDIYSQHLLRKWRIGDEVCLRNTNQSGFLLQNYAAPRFLPLVAPVLYDPSHLITLAAIADEGNTLLLSDGSQWILTFNFQRNITTNWQIGDFIFPVKCVHEGYELINIDTPYSDNLPYDMRPPNHRHVNAFLTTPPIAIATQKEEVIVAIVEDPQIPPEPQSPIIEETFVATEPQTPVIEETLVATEPQILAEPQPPVIEETFAAELPKQKRASLFRDAITSIKMKHRSSPVCSSTEPRT